MNLWKDTYPIIVLSARGLIPHTSHELLSMGYSIVDTTETTVVVRGSMRDVMKLNLQLRTGHRILVPLLRTECKHLRELYEDVYSIEWENLLDADGYFTVNSIVNNPTITDTRMPSLKAKDAIADRMRQHCGGRPDSGRETYGAAVFVYWQERELIIYLDTTGEPLSRRGYRMMPGKAPMSETLAAGCVLASGWKGDTPFVAPMCGSGTPAIEAALIAINRAPGSFKSHFAFMSIKGYRITIPGERAGTSVRMRFGASPEQIWKEMVQTAHQEERKENLPPIIASDIDGETVELAHSNAIAAGVAEYITFTTCDFASTPLPAAPATIFMNPEYGERLGGDTDLEPLYKRIGDFFKQKCLGYTACVLTGNMEMSRRIGLRSQRRVPFFNGPIECRMVVFDKLYPGSFE